MLGVLLPEVVMVLAVRSTIDTTGGRRPMLGALLPGVTVDIFSGRYMALDAVGCNGCFGQWGATPEGTRTEGCPLFDDDGEEGREGGEKSGCNVDGVDKTIPTIAVVLSAEAWSVVVAVSEACCGFRSAVAATPTANSRFRIPRLSALEKPTPWTSEARGRL